MTWTSASSWSSVLFRHHVSRPIRINLVVNAHVCILCTQLVHVTYCCAMDMNDKGAVCWTCEAHEMAAVSPAVLTIAVTDEVKRVTTNQGGVLVYSSLLLLSLK
jgi:hypothetical protein